MKNSNTNQKSASQVDLLSSLGIAYADDIWILGESSSGSADKSIVIRWKSDKKNVELSPYYTDLLKKFAAGMLLGVIGSYAPGTIKPKVLYLRRLFFRIHAAGYERIGLITSTSIVKIISSEATKGKGVTKDTLEWWGATINQFFRLRIFIKECFIGRPISRKEIMQISNSLREPGYWEAPPEPVCIFLLRESMNFMTLHSGRILDFYESYISAVDNGVEMGINTARRMSAHIATKFRQKDFSDVFKDIRGCEQWAADALSLGKLIRHLSTACFIVITFTCGQRVSEIRRAGSRSVVSRLHDNGVKYYYYHAPRSKIRYNAEKKQSDGTGHSNAPWVLSPAAVEAFNILLRLSKPARQRSGLDNLWLTPFGNALWPFFPKRSFNVVGSAQINVRINNFASLIGLETNTGWRGRLHSHMGRKHLARFVAKRDRSALGELAQQYSHLSADSVDISYARPDSEFRRMLSEELGDEMAKLGSTLLETSTGDFYATHENNRIQKFLGELRQTRDIKLLISSGTVMLPCQWGVCLYLQETSACDGSRSKPNIAKRSPEVCAKCTNFLSTPRHLQWWTEFESDCKKIMKQSKLPDQTRLVVLERLASARAVISKIKVQSHE
ncbi:hypothetical protein [Pseudomonas syringae]|uniref:hypothetical protein n=1 Tax=Pseudomonas syringae TaxID=317 RepID=UPI0013C2DF2D|nr:hypothetical protein [Pseudomonas syringae]